MDAVSVVRPRSGLRASRNVLTVLLGSTLACEPPPLPQPDPVTHADLVEAWKESRYATLQKSDGWLSLVGLFWLETEQQTFGSDSLADFRIDSRPARRYGTFHARGDSIRFRAAPGISVIAGESVVTDVDLTPRADVPPLVLRSDSIRWVVLTRGGRPAVRVWDALSPVRTRFDGIAMFPLALDWHLPGLIRFHDPPDTIDVPNFLGTVNRVPSPATVSFVYDGKRYSLDLWKDSDDPANYFTAFGDATNGGETYGGGRFLWIDAPDERGRTVVDFNRAYNPPCVFTPYATCPLPPRQNRLPFAVTAGEREWAGH